MEESAEPAVQEAIDKMARTGVWIRVSAWILTLMILPFSILMTIGLAGSGPAPILAPAGLLPVVMPWAAFRAAGACNRCTKERNIESLANAIRVQARVWVAVVVFSPLAIFAVLEATSHFRRAVNSLRPHRTAEQTAPEGVTVKIPEDAP